MLLHSCSAVKNLYILSKYELVQASARRQLASARRQLASARRQIGTGLFFFFVQTFVDFALSLPRHSL